MSVLDIIGGNLGLEMTGDIELQVVSIWTVLNVEDRGHDTPALFTPWEKKSERREKKGIEYIEREALAFISSSTAAWKSNDCG